MTSDATVSLSGLTPLEVAELKAALVEVGCDPATTLQTSKVTGGVSGAKKGEPATMLAIVVVGQLAMTGLSLYLARGGERSRRVEKLVFQDAEGRRLEHTIEITSSKAEAINADLMQQVAKLKMPTSHTRE